MLSKVSARSWISSRGPDRARRWLRSPEAARLAAAFIEDSGRSIRPASTQPTVPETTASIMSIPTAERRMVLSSSNRFVSTLAACGVVASMRGIC